MQGCSQIAEDIARRVVDAGLACAVARCDPASDERLLLLAELDLGADRLLDETGQGFALAQYTLRRSEERRVGKRV